MGEEMQQQVRVQERERLRHIIQQWNSNRLDLFEISEPDENLEFHGVMRFYFQDSGQKVATKCIRVSSAATTRHVIGTLIEKFRPDMRMLSIPEYTLYEIHENGDERRLSEEEKPLLVQLNWNKDDREGRFLLRRMDMNGIMKIKTLPPVLSPSQPPAMEESFIRKLSRREKKALKKQEKIRKANENHENENSVAEKLYTELPETSFTRSISNPEAVMRRRRAQKLEKKLQQFRSKDGGPDTGGTLKIYGESLCQDVPYKTLLLSVRDNAASVVKEMLEKYGLYREDPGSYCLVQCIVTAEETVEGYQGKIVPQKEYILEDDECPLAILMNHPPSRGSIMFQVRRRPADHGQRRRKKKSMKGPGAGHYPPSQRHTHHAEDLLPHLVELGPDGNESPKGRQHQLHLNVTEVGSDRSAHTGGQSLQLFGPHIQPRHCVIAHTDEIVTVTPCSPAAETYVNFQRIYETTILQHGSIVRFGRSHTFRFIDPQQDDRLVHRLPSPQTMHSHPHYLDRNSYDRFAPPRDPILPAVLEFREEMEDAFLHSITTQLDPTDIQFKLAPTYTLYMAARFRASTHYRPDLSPTERALKLTVMLTKVASIVHKVIEFKHRDPTALAFWMANASELLHFLKQDRHICGYSLDAQDILAEAVQFAFRKLVDYMQTELSSAMPVFLEDRDDKEEEEGTTAHVLSLLTNTMALLRRCRVNAALTIQLFSQLFHYINMWVFNKVVTENFPNYCSRVWGERIKERLGRIELWAEKQGLELAADCHLAKLSQAALLLIAPKSSPDDAAAVSSTCFKLNSIQLSELLEKYQLAPDEPAVPKELIDNVVSVAETTADGLAREDGREVRLEEDADLQLPFLLPEDGYSCDIVRGIPSGLAEFLDPLQRAQLCSMTPQPTSSGFWTIYMHNHPETQGQRPPVGPRSPSAMSNRSISLPRGEPDIHTIELKKFNNGMGLSIVATKGENQDQLGIYIKSVVPGGAADQDGRLQAGDQLLSVDGKSLVGISQEEAAQYMVGTGSVVTLEVARQGALYHGLAPILSQPSPQVNRVETGRAASFPRHRDKLLRPPSIPEVYNERLVDWNKPPPKPELRLPLSSPPLIITPKISSPQSPSPVSESSPPSCLPPTQVTSEKPSKTGSNSAAASSPPGMPDHRREVPPNMPGANSSGASHLPPHHPHHPLPPQSHFHPPKHPQSRMQSSKSVPSLNSEVNSSGAKVSPHEVFNPVYSRTSSSTSLTQSHNHYHPPQPQQYPVRSRSTQNLNDGGAFTLTGRHPSSPALNTEDDRHYQNVSFHQGSQDPRMGSQRGGRPPIFPSQMGGGQPDHHRPTSAFMHRDDLLRSEVMHRPTSQQNLRQDPRAPVPGAGPRYNGHQFAQSAPLGSPGSNPSLHRIQHPQHPPPRTQPKYGSQYGPPPPQMSPQSYYPPGPVQAPDGSPHGAPPPHASPQYANSPQGIGGTMKQPPPTAPKPNRWSGNFGGPDAPEKPSRQMPPDGPPRPPPPPDEPYRESPPPPPPPTSTHPLMQTTGRGGPPPSLPPPKTQGFKGPWEKDDKEKYDMWKREAARRWRDEQISALESLDAKTPQEQERMNTLKLEREFQRRAEAQRDEDDDDDEDETSESRDPAPGNSPHGEWHPQQSPVEPETPVGVLPTQQGPANGNDVALEAEIWRKQQELEAAKEAEEKLLKEAQRRQEEELRRQQQLHHHHPHNQQVVQQRHQHQASQRLDSLVGAPPLPQVNNGPLNGLRGAPSYGDPRSPNTPAFGELRSPSSPLPPERGSSYSIMHHHQQQIDGVHPRGRPLEGGPVKRVQFSEVSSAETRITYDSNANQEKTTSREDPYNFINEAESLMNATSPNRNTGNTPGVIGAQEVYRDPRQRRLMEQAQKAAASRSTGPEKLTFREKMKMFAMETEEGDSPKDRIKHSKAQREIDHPQN